MADPMTLLGCFPLPLHPSGTACTPRPTPAATVVLCRRSPREAGHHSAETRAFKCRPDPFNRSVSSGRIRVRYIVGHTHIGPTAIRHFRSGNSFRSSTPRMPEQKGRKIRRAPSDRISHLSASLGTRPKRLLEMISLVTRPASLDGKT